MQLIKVEKTYNKFKELSINSYHRRNFDSFISLADNAANIASIFNSIYYDEVFEDYFKKIAIENIKKPINFIKYNRKIVFYDEIGTVACLSVQYILALIELEYEILYIFHSDTRILSPFILKILEGYDKCKIVITDSLQTDKVDKIKFLYNEITTFGPEKAILHTPAAGALGAILWYSLEYITRFRVVPGDHHFYFGVNCTDYFLEFRNFGYTTAIEKRNIDKNKIFIQPYYPLLHNTIDFQGFPVDISKGITIFSAASPYKVYGENDKYFNIIKKILETYPEVTFLFAGGGFLYPFKKFIRNNNFENRIFLLGYRKDIDKCIQNCDIYMCSYPMTGGLTSQYAAFYAKPILSYTDTQLPGNKIEDIIEGVTKHEKKITYDSEKDFFEFINDLIKDENFRKGEGQYLKDKAFHSDNFAKILESNLNLKSQSVPRLISINYDKIVKVNLEKENKYVPGFRIYMLLYLLKSKNIKNFSFLIPELMTSRILFRSLFNKIF